MKIADLNALYTEADQVDRDVFAEMRSNILLIAGEHYTKRNQLWDRKIRATQDLTEQQKLRLTKNHIHRAHRYYVTSVLSYAGGVSIMPANEKERKDVKDAALNKSVKEHIHAKHRFNEKVKQWASDYCGIGEVGVKIFWDPNAGTLTGYAPQTDPETGEPVMQDTGEQEPVTDPATGQPAMDPASGQPQMQPKMAQVPDEDSPIFSGDFVFERIFGFNLLRDPSANDMRDTGKPWIIRKMTSVKALKAKYKADPDKIKMITEGGGDEYVVFDASKASYEKKKGQCLVREYYYPVSVDFPEGYFFITVQGGILEEGPLPFGIWPIAWNGMDEFQTSPRRRSVLKVARPFQAEINRASSQAAMAQITIGDDKVLYQKGAKLDQGSLLPGVRGIAYTGAPPTVMPGRDGSHFMPYIASQISEMESALMLPELKEERQAQMDPYTLLQRSAKEREKFSFYSEKFEQFMIDVWEITLDLARRYLPDEALVPMIGKHEYVNIEEFRNTSPLCYLLKIEPESETVDSKLGKQMALNQALQYVGKNLSKEQTAKVMLAMPFANLEKAFGDMLLDEENAENDILALERGQYPKGNKYENHEFLIKELVSRTKERDFELLDPQIQELFAKKIQEHEQLQEQQVQAAQALKNDFIPVGGALIACDMYVPDPENPEKLPRRVRVPYQALDWLVSTLDKQGASQKQLETMNQGALSEMQQMMGHGTPQQPQAASGPGNASHGQLLQMQRQAPQQPAQQRPGA